MECRITDHSDRPCCHQHEGFFIQSFSHLGVHTLASAAPGSVELGDDQTVTGTGEELGELLHTLDVHHVTRLVFGPPPVGIAGHRGSVRGRNRSGRKPGRRAGARGSGGERPGRVEGGARVDG